ncbi:MAG: hypothetical protein RIC14_03050 [Filomicrobium sp.]
MYQCQSDFLNVPQDEWRIDCELNSLASTLSAISPQSAISFEFWAEQVSAEFHYSNPDAILKNTKRHTRIEAPHHGDDKPDSVIELTCVDDDQVGARITIVKNNAKQECWSDLQIFWTENSERIKKTILSSAYKWSGWAIDRRMGRILNTAPTPTFVVDENAMVQFPSGLPLDLKALLPKISVCPKRQIRLQNGTDTGHLHKLIKESIRGRKRRAFRLADDAEEREWAVLVQPILGQTEEHSGSGVLTSKIRFAPLAIVCVQPLRQQLVTAEIVKEYYGLTSSESELTAAVVNGQTVSEYASHKQISVATARWHLRNVLRGTNSKSQLELVSKTISMLGTPLY